jgi:hypothetical protein
MLVFVLIGILVTRLRDSQTPDELDMEDDDVIDAMLFQVGGR